MTVNVNTINFGVEIETHIASSDDTHINGYHSSYPTCVAWLPSGWKAEHDCSIRRPAGRKAAEFVSPKLAGEAGLAEVFESVEKIKARGARVNESCGVHVTVSFPSNDAAALARLVSLVAHFEKGLFAATGTHNREHNLNAPGGSWAKGLSRYGAGKKGSRAKAAAARSEASRSRYHALNLTHLAAGENRVEFRLFSGSTNAAKVVAFVRLAVAMVEYALNTDRAVNFESRSKDRRWGGEGESTLVQLFCRLGWLRWKPWGYKGTTYGEVTPVGLPSMESSTATLRRLAKKYDG